MADRRLPGSLRTRGLVWSLAAMVAGALATWVWAASQMAWTAHLNRAFVSGIAIHDALDRGAPAPEGIRITPLPPNHPSNLGGRPPSGMPAGALVTQVSFLGTSPASGSVALPGQRLQLQILSADLQYPVAAVPRDGGTGPAAGMANIARLLASFCSDPVVFARPGDGPWFRIDGAAVWGCAAHPRDMRLAALLGLALAMAVILSQVAETAAAFSGFAAALRNRRGLGLAGPDAFPLEGPAELRQTVAAVNDYLATERDRLEKRALVLSGVSHDLGTPATRLRLRTALIEDVDLRGRLEADIDRMTGMIESVLTYTRAEIGIEPPRELSLTALIEAVVAEYQDTGQPVTFLRMTEAEIGPTRSVFTSGGRPTQVRLEETRRILVQARPMALQRALGNLIDNALKYGRRATVSLTATADTAVIAVQDEGAGLSEQDMARLTEPFTRGANAGMAAGIGLGLTIVTTIAAQHGGALDFERRPGGLCARLTIARR